MRIKTVFLSIRLTPSMKAGLAEAAKRAKMSQAAVIERLITRHCNRLGIDTAQKDGPGA